MDIHSHKDDDKRVQEEVARFTVENIVGFDTPMVLKSESAVCAVASKVLL